MAMFLGPSSLVNNGLLDPDRLFINNGDKTFTIIDTAAGISNVLPARGTAYSDYDNDGDIDLLSVVYNKPHFGFSPQTILYENISENNNNWVGIKLEGLYVNRDAYGSKVYVYTPNRTLMRELSGGASFCSHHTSVLHIGIGADTQVDSVQIVWTGGMNRQTENEILVNSINYITENNISVSTQNAMKIPQYIVSPNPTTGSFTITSELGLDIQSIKCYNVIGSEKYLNWIQMGNEIEIKMTTSPGLYFVILETKTGSQQSLKMIVE